MAKTASDETPKRKAAPMTMEYRTFPHGGERASVIGFGMGSIHEASDEREIEAALELALDAGVNFFDLAPSEAAPYAPYGRMLAPQRADILTQMHLGAVYGANGQYGWSRDLDAIKRQFARVLDTLGTDYTDFGIIHCMDEDDDFDAMQENGIWATRSSSSARAWSATWASRRTTPPSRGASWTQAWWTSACSASTRPTTTRRAPTGEAARTSAWTCTALASATASG